eukprot:m.197843 g.197843  ORF g.197843 m.197843 type:complete len:347 (+) comp18357_c0_seq3:232-1272(+)
MSADGHPRQGLTSDGMIHQYRYKDTDMSMTSTGVGVGLGATLRAPRQIPPFASATSRPIPEDLLPRSGIQQWQTTNNTTYANPWGRSSVQPTTHRHVLAPSVHAQTLIDDLPNVQGSRRSMDGNGGAHLTPGRRGTEARSRFDPELAETQLMKADKARLQQEEQEHTTQFHARVQAASRPLITASLRPEVLTPFRPSSLDQFTRRSEFESHTLRDPPITWATGARKTVTPTQKFSKPQGPLLSQESAVVVQRRRALRGGAAESGASKKGRGPPDKSLPRVPYSGSSSLARDSFVAHPVQRNTRKEVLLLKQRGSAHPPRRVDRQFFDPSVTYRTSYQASHGIGMKW